MWTWSRLTCHLLGKSLVLILNKTKISGTDVDMEPADLPFVGQKPGPNVPAVCQAITASCIAV